MPELERVVEMSKIFNVSTDYLLKESRGLYLPGNFRNCKLDNISLTSSDKIIKQSFYAKVPE